MKFTKFWTREKKAREDTRDSSQEAQTSIPEPNFPMQKHQKLVLRESQICLTVPQKAVDALRITTKRFIEWQRRKQELHGSLLMSETTHTTRIEHLTHTDQYIALVPASLIDEYALKATKDAGPSAICEWNDATLRIRIPLPQKGKNKNTPKK